MFAVYTPGPHCKVSDTVINVCIFRLSDQGFDSSADMQLSDYNFASVACEKTAPSFWLYTKHRRFPPENPVSSCSNSGSIRDDPYWNSGKNCLELIELSSINIVSLVLV